jgi:uncharacterized membrane protein
MSGPVLSALLIVGAVGSGLIGGLFFAFSTFVMRAFDRLPAAQAIGGMQSINITVLNPLFFLAFFGTAAIALALLVIAVPRLGEPVAVLIAAGAIAYLVGAIGVTIVCNVPLNDQLAALKVLDSTATEQWRAYAEPWTWWNHVRTIASLAAAGAFAAALYLS